MKEGKRRNRPLSAWNPNGDAPDADGARARRGWSNLVRGIAWLMLGVLAVALIEWAWDAAHAAEAGGSGAESFGGADGGIDGEDMTAFIMRGDAGGMWREGGPSWFAEECLEAADLGEVCSSFGGDVVGVASDYPAKRLFGLCCERLEQRGWHREASGQPLRSAFLKETGDVRWVFLDVVRVADGSVAVFVREGLDG